MLSHAIEIGLVLIGLAMLLNLWRLLRGPDITDRILALDTLNINAIALLVLFGIRAGSSAYFEAALVLAAMSFVGTMAPTPRVVALVGPCRRVKKSGRRTSPIEPSRAKTAPSRIRAETVNSVMKLIR